MAVETGFYTQILNIMAECLLKPNSPQMKLLSDMKTCRFRIAFIFQYENQVSMLGNWINKGPTMSRPKFSDSQGKVCASVDLYSFVQAVEFLLL